MTNSTRSPKTRLRKSIACNRCHSRKVKCNGEHPCASCVTHGRPEDCSYPSRTSRKILVEESYIDGLVAEVDRLRSTSEASSGAQDVGRKVSNDQWPFSQSSTIIKDLWFEHQSNLDLPVYIGEAACTAFATRARQALSNATEGGHLVRAHFILDEQLMQAPPETEMNLPSRMQATILARIAQSTIGKLYYLLQWSTMENTISCIYDTPDRASNKTKCKALLVFALGELYAPQAMVSSPGTYPGLSYFREARRRLNLFPERCTLEDLENYLMMTLYSLALNRRNSAFFLIGTVVKLSIGLGLHHPICKTQMPNDGLRNHRNRLWWTVYILDRTLTSSLGHPVSIDDLHIDNGLPESSPDDETDSESFDGAYYHALIGWSRIIGTVDDYLFDRTLTVDQVLQRARDKVHELERWHNSVPEMLKVTQTDNIEQYSRNVIMLHLAYNQGIILCTRASLHYMLRVRKHRRLPPTETTCPQLLKDLADKCRVSAVESMKLIVGLFVSGAVPSFDYFYSHYLFSALTIASITAILGMPTPNLSDDISSAETVLHSLGLAGNLAAKEFVRNIDAFRNVMSKQEQQTLPAYGFDTIQNDDAQTAPSDTISDQNNTSMIMSDNDPSNAGRFLFSDPWLEVMNMPISSAQAPWLYAWPEFTNGNLNL